MSTFETKEEGPIHYIYFPDKVDETTVKQLPVYMKNWLGVSCQLHLFDGQNLQELDPASFREFTQFARDAKKNGQYVMSINLKKDIFNMIREQGLTNVFSPVDSLTEAKKKAGLSAPKKSVPVDFLNPFFDSTKKAIKIQADTSIEPGKPRKKAAEDQRNVEVAGVISLNSDSFNGSITLCFPKKVFLGLYENMVGEKHEEINDEIKDAASELLNIIFGQAKAELVNNKGYTIQKAIPTVLTGEKINVSHGSSSAAFLLPFSTEFGPFHIEIALEDE